MTDRRIRKRHRPCKTWAFGGFFDGAVQVHVRASAVVALHRELQVFHRELQDGKSATANSIGSTALARNTRD
jgi:hypothetical protein